MDNNEIVSTEVLEATNDAGKDRLIFAAVVGGSMVIGALLWNRAIKPAGRWIKTRFAEVKEERNKAKDEEAVQEESDE